MSMTALDLHPMFMPLLALSPAAFLLRPKRPAPKAVTPFVARQRAIDARRTHQSIEIPETTWDRKQPRPARTYRANARNSVDTKRGRRAIKRAVKREIARLTEFKVAA